jgi:hypothetical protein
MSRRFVELVVRARRLVIRAPERSAAARQRRRLTATRQVGGELTQVSFRLALVIDLAYVGVGALGGVAVARAAGPASPAPNHGPLACTPDSTAHSDVPDRVAPNAPSSSWSQRLPASADTLLRKIR